MEAVLQLEPPLSARMNVAEPSAFQQAAQESKLDPPVQSESALASPRWRASDRNTR